MLTGHIPVMLTEVMQALAIKPDGIYVDLTFGRGGHAQAILAKLTTGKLFAFDKDKTAIVEGSKVFGEKHHNFQLIHADFKDFKYELAQLGINRVDGILADLGVSSPQVDQAARGFSFRKEAMLDMRMNQDAPLTAHEIVNRWTEDQLVNVLRNYADVKPARQVAKGIISQRPIDTTIHLAKVVNAALPPKMTRLKNYPKVVFQALRIAVNGELDALAKMLPDGIDMLNPNGVIAIISFHSLEDRIVKKVFGHLTKDFTGKIPILTTPKYTVKTYRPQANEIEINRRARSAKLRALQKRGENDS